MPKLIKLHGRSADWANEAFVHVGEEDAVPETGGVILSLARFQAEGDSLLGEGRTVGVRLESDQAVEDLVYDLPRLALVALAFPKFRDGRAYSAAALLRERYGYKGELRAVGDVLLEQAHYMARVGFDAFEPADGTSVEQWANRIGIFRHVYQAAADGRAPAFVERA